MPILPLIDLMILLSSGSLVVAFVLKGVALTTHYRPAPMGLGPFDWVIVAAVFLAFAVALAARTWVKLNEPKLLTLRRAEDQRRAEEIAALEAQQVHAQLEPDTAAVQADEPTPGLAGR